MSQCWVFSVFFDKASYFFFALSGLDVATPQVTVHVLSVINMASLCYRITFARVVGPEHETKLLVSLVCLIMEEYAMNTMRWVVKITTERRKIHKAEELRSPNQFQIVSWVIFVAPTFQLLRYLAYFTCDDISGFIHIVCVNVAFALCRYSTKDTTDPEEIVQAVARMQDTRDFSDHVVSLAVFFVFLFGELTGSFTGNAVAQVNFTNLLTRLVMLIFNSTVVVPMLSKKRTSELRDSMRYVEEFFNKRDEITGKCPGEYLWTTAGLLWLGYINISNFMSMWPMVLFHSIRMQPFLTEGWKESFQTASKLRLQNQ